MAITHLNKALQEVYTWYLDNQLTPHPGKSEAMLLSARNPMGPIAPAFIGRNNLTANFSHDQRPVQRSVLRFAAVGIYIQLKMRFFRRGKGLEKNYALTGIGIGLKQRSGLRD